MGEVYRARDTKLNREVALKVLPDAFTLDPDRLARFKREAQVLASLNHPHIGAIYGFEDSPSAGSGQAGIHALVLELVEGETLADRIARGPISLDEAVPIARQICEAIEAAHEQAIIHRDLKPSNIKITSDGVVKVLDFGLAKLAHAEAATHASNITTSPTITSPAMMTGVGVILGTAAYMAPEQAKGREADKRSDIWAFGCVLYEMLTGKRPFDGEDVSDTLANVLKIDPDWSALPLETPPAIRTLLQSCLVKDRRRRVADISTALFVLDNGARLAPPAGTRLAVSQHRSLWWRTATLTASALVVGIVATALTWFATRPMPPRVSRLQVAPSGASALTIIGDDRSLAITPDNSHLIYVGNRGTQIFVRALNALEPVAVFTGAPHGLFVSPDGQWIGFGDGLIGLRKVAVTGGPAVTLATLQANRGATWGPDDNIIVATGNPTTGLQRVLANGEVTVLTTPDRSRGEADHLWPEFLPNGHTVLFTITAMSGGLGAAQIAMLDLRTGTQTVLLRGGTHAHYVPSGHLVYAAAGTLRAVAFDLATLKTLGTPVPVVPDVVTTPAGGANAVTSGDGTLAYVSGGALQSEVRTLVWVDRRGHEEPLKAPVRAYVYPRLSPDGTRVAAELRDEDWDIWILNLVSPTLTRFSFGSNEDRLPIWTPDGKRIVWTSSREGLANPYWQAADGSGTVEQLIKSPAPQFVSAISPDGTQLVLREGAATRDLMVVAMEKEPRLAQPLVRTPFVETSAEISPDGQWMAYQSNESGQDEVYVRPFPNVNAGRWPVSIGGGAKPLWARNGRELFYMVPSGSGIAVMSTPIERGASFAAGTPTKVLEGPYFFGTAGTGATAFRTYDVSLDGQRFLMIKNPEESEQAATSMNFVQNWTEELKRLVPTR